MAAVVSLGPVPPPACPFDCIVVTAANERQAVCYQEELALRQQIGFFPPTVQLLSVSDPEGCRVGSGGGTLNALLKAARSLSAKDGTLSAQEALVKSRVLCIHSGGDSQRNPTQSVCGKAWNALNIVGHGGHLNAPVDLLCFQLFRLCRSVQPGSFVVSCCDVILMLEGPLEVLLPSAGVWGLGIYAAATYGPHHGVYVADVAQPQDACRVRRFLQKASMETLAAEGAILSGSTVLVDSGVVCFDAACSVRLLELCTRPPFAGCVGVGPPFRLELYSEVLSSIGEVCGTKDQYMRAFGQAAPSVDALSALSDLFSSTEFNVLVVPSAKFAHLGTTAELVAAQTCSDPAFRGLAEHFRFVDSASSHGALCARSVAVGSLLSGGGRCGPGTVVEFSKLSFPWSVGSGAMVSGIRWPLRDLQVDDGVVVQQLEVEARSEGAAASSFVFVVFHVHDAVKLTRADPAATVCGGTWPNFMAALGVDPEDVWPGTTADEQTLWSAKLYPVYASVHELEGLPPLLLQGVPAAAPSLHFDVRTRWRAARRLSMRELVSGAASPSAEFRWRRAVQGLVEAAGVEPSKLLCPAETIACGPSWHLSVETGKLDATCARARSPARAAACCQELEAVPGMRPECQFLPPEDRLPEQTAAKLLVRQAVASCKEFIVISRAPAPIREGVAVTVEAPARIDLAGGWSDTAPICYEHGGSVTNLAVLVDGRRPFGARAELLGDSAVLVLEFWSDSPSRTVSSCHEKTTISELGALQDHGSPAAPVNLLKCCVLCTDLVSVSPGAPPLSEQLRVAGGGLRLITWSSLPKGSGLGGSSIVAAVCIRAILAAYGFTIDHDSLIHAVLNVEQMLTTGGGWQDQAGAVRGGAKIARSAAKLPLRVVSEVLPMSDYFEQELADHVVLVYTGKQRLAKNLLDNVLLRFRLPNMLKMMGEIVATAEESADAIRREDLAALAKCLSTYWSQKKVLAPGSETAAATEIFEMLRPALLGCSLAGAGGGGFAVLITKDKKAHEWIRGALGQCADAGGATVHEIHVDRGGICLTIEQGCHSLAPPTS